MTMAGPVCQCDSPLSALFGRYRCELHGTRENRDTLLRLQAQRERYVEALGRIAAGPNDAPFSEPWSRAEAMIALDRKDAP